MHSKQQMLSNASEEIQSKIEKFRQEAEKDLSAAEGFTSEGYALRVKETAANKLKAVEILQDLFNKTTNGT